MNKHDLENMIFNLEERKGLKKVEFTQKAVVEILEYLKEIQDLEAKLAESEKALEAKESVNRMYKATLDLKDSDFSDLVRENAKLKQQLTEKEAEVEGRKRLNSLRYAQLERQDKEIKELEQQLAEANKKPYGVPIPKFKIRQKLYRVEFGSIVPFKVNEITIQINADESHTVNYFDYVGITVAEGKLFETLDQAIEVANAQLDKLQKNQ